MATAGETRGTHAKATQHMVAKLMKAMETVRVSLERHKQSLQKHVDASRQLSSQFHDLCTAARILQDSVTPRPVGQVRVVWSDSKQPLAPNEVAVSIRVPCAYTTKLSLNDTDEGCGKPGAWGIELHLSDAARASGAAYPRLLQAADNGECYFHSITWLCEEGAWEIVDGDAEARTAFSALPAASVLQLLRDWEQTCDGSFAIPLLRTDDLRTCRTDPLEWLVDIRVAIE